MAKQNKFQYTMTIITVLLIYFFGTAGSFMTAAVRGYMEAWPDVSQTTILMVNTIPALVSMPMMLFVGAFVGTKISYRNAALIGSVLVVIGGLVPVFYAPSWTFVLICRFIVGVGAGFYGMRAALMIRTCADPKDQARFLGLGQAIFNIGGMAIPPLVAVLVGLGWQYSFLVNLFPILIFIMTLFFIKEPGKDNSAVAEETQAQAEDNRSAVKAQLDKRIVVYWILHLICTGCIYPILSTLTIYFDEYSIGGDAAASLGISCFTAAAAIAGFFIVPFQKIFKRKVMFVGYLLAAVGQAIVLFFPNVVAVYIGEFIAGFGYSLAFTMFTVYIGQIAHPSRVTMATTVLMLVNQGGLYISSYIILVAHAIFHRPTSTASAFMLNMFAQVVFAVITLFGRLIPKEGETAETVESAKGTA